MAHQTKKDFLEKTRDDITAWYDYFSDQNNKYAEDRAFVFADGRQWPETVKEEYDSRKKLALQLNILKPALKQTIGDLLPAIPSLYVKPLSPNIPEPALDVRADLIRSIMKQSNALGVFQHALECALSGGYGAIRIKTDYESSTSFDQKIVVCRQENPQACYWDPKAELVDKSDGDYCGFFKIISKTAFEAKYPNKKWDELKSTLSGLKNEYFPWINADDEQITVCYHYCKKYFKDTLVELSNGVKLKEKMLEQYYADFVEEAQAQFLMSADDTAVFIPPALPTIIKKRAVINFTIKAYELIGCEILAKTEWACKELPIIFVDGASELIDGEQHIESFIHNAKDPQQAVNFIFSEIMQHIKKHRREQWLTTKKHIKGLTKFWRDPEALVGALVYNPDPAAPPPREVESIPFPPALAEQLQATISQLLITLGRAEASQGLESNEISGRAIIARVAQNNHTVRIYYDHLLMALQQVGKIIMGLIPVIYGSERFVRIYTSENQDQLIGLNTPNAMGEIQNDMLDGEFHVEIDAGAPNALEREAEFSKMTQGLQLIENPIGMAFADLIFKELNLSITPELIKRARMVMPQNIVAAENNQPSPPTPPSPEDMLLNAQANQANANALLKRTQAINAASDPVMKAQENALRKADIQKQLIETELSTRAANAKSAAEVYKANAQIHQTLHELNHLPRSHDAG